MGALRYLIWAAAALAIVITTTSAYIRLAQAGLGCSDWPACYAPYSGQAAEVAPESPIMAARALHRLAASAVGILLIAIVFVGWGKLAALRARWSAVALLVLAGFLAWLGRYTPSSLPAVTLGNLLGGLAIVALLASMAFAARGGGRLGAAPRLAIVAALAAAILQVALGGMLGARFAVPACASFPDCGGALWIGGDALRILNPLLHDASAWDASSLQAAHLAHRWMGIAVAALGAWTAIAAVRSGGRLAGGILIALIGAQVVLGGAMVQNDFPLLAALAHNVLAALLISTLTVLALAPRQDPE